MKFKGVDYYNIDELFSETQRRLHFKGETAFLYGFSYEACLIVHPPSTLPHLHGCVSRLC